jgi:hypothetical protein
MMPDELSISYQGEEPRYVVIERLADHAVFVPSNSMWEASFDDASFPRYAIPLRKAELDRWVGNFPAQIPTGTKVAIRYYEHARGAEPASTDLRVRRVRKLWNGTRLWALDENGEPEGRSAMDPTPEPQLQKCWRLAHDSFQRAILAQDGPPARPLKGVWKWLKEQDPDDEYDLPTLGTWMKYLRNYHRSVSGKTNSSRRGRAGRSAASRGEL